MDHNYHGRPPTRRRAALGDATLYANEDQRPQRHQMDKHSHESAASPPLNNIPHNQPLVLNGTLTVRQQHLSSPENKRISAVINKDVRPHNPKRDSDVSNASTNASNNGRRRKSHIGPWQLGKTIGRGGCSRVRLVKHSTTGQLGAAKIILKATAEKVRALSLANLTESAENDPTLFPGGRVIPFGLEREICIMKLLDHQNIVRLYDIWENRNELYLIMEYVEGGELFSYIDTEKGLPEIWVVHLFRQIIAALQYCHRINIHHRDLKPENILLDLDNRRVKLVDFGMAALQPTGKMLTTPCGSPHYAAPEVIKSAPYDGAQADVWSCGVILYVLLTGTPPFNNSTEDNNFTHLFYAISKAQYIMPDGLSREAQDLIRRILVPNPKRRITIEGIWNHPFLRKYDKELQITAETATMHHWVGPGPLIEDWQKLERPTIDREILRYLRTLWHSEKEDIIIQRLLNKDANQEKYFYSALQKYRDNELENYAPSPHHAIAYSNSDHHHHARQPPTQQAMEQPPSKGHKRSQSAFSILNDEHLYSQHSFYDVPPSDTSYDPFRASREPIIPGHTTHQNVTIRRDLSNESRKMRPATALGHHGGSSLRKKALKNSKRSSNASQRSGRSRRSTSRSSLVSSHWPSSPPIIVRPGSLGKRGVSFSHLRGSAATFSTAEGGFMHHTPTRTCDSIGSHGFPPVPSSPIQQSPDPFAASKTAGRSAVPKLKVRKPESPSKYIQTEVRKVSTELEKTMEEAFNRSSMSSSIRTRATDPKEASEYDTPPTSISNRGSGGSMLVTPNNKTGFENRPLLPVPTETPNTFLQRKLAETRAEIARRLDQGSENPEHYVEVLEHLDRLMIPPSTGARRIASAPVRTPEPPLPLQVIPEEVKPDGDERFDPYVCEYRPIADPFRPNMQGRRAVTDHNTIRIVDSSSPTRIAPLNIRKRGGASTPSRSEMDSRKMPWLGPTSDAAGRLDLTAQEDYFYLHPNRNAVSEGVAQGAHEKKDATVKKKKSSWFRCTPEEKELQQENQPVGEASRAHIPQVRQDLDDRIKDGPPATSIPSVEFAKHNPKVSDTTSSSEFPMRHCVAVGKPDSGGRKGFFGLFGKKSKDAKDKRSLELGTENFSSNSLLSGTDLGSQEGAEVMSHTGPREVQMNWLSRFLHIKPASKVLCFQVGRGKARQDLVRLLRDWQRFGVRDVVFDRQTNVVNARIDKNNHLKIKPVSLIIELFVVLENGRRANLCLGRFTQTRGAASSFRKVVDIVEDVCRARNMLVEEEEKWASMCEILS